jgi:two-component SAPR family response regulator
MKVLVVDDESYVLEEIIDDLKAYDPSFVIRGFNNPAEALALCESDPPDLAFLDIELSSGNGIELAHDLLALNSDLKVAFVTAYNNYASEAFEAHAIDYLLKPIRIERLHQTVKKMMEEVQRGRIVGNRNSVGELSVRIFGGLRVSFGAEPLVFKRKKSAELFSFLLMHRGLPRHKDLIIDALYPDMTYPRAVTHLQTALYSLRKSLGGLLDKKVGIHYANEAYVLEIHPDYYDLEAFEAVSETPDGRILKIYKGRVFQQESWLWALPMQEKLEGRFLQALDHIIRSSYEKGDTEVFTEAVWRARPLLIEEEERFAEYREMVRAYLGARTEAMWVGFSEEI